MTTKIDKPKSKFKKCSFNDPFIYVVDNALSKKFCKKVIKKFNDDDRKCKGVIGGRKSGGTKRNQKVKTSIDLCISQLPEWKNEDEVFYKSLTENYVKYCERLPDLFFATVEQSLFDTGYQIQRTEPGGYYIFHHDFEPDTVRYLTFIWYLNDIKNDGYTEFIDGTRIQPKAGRFLMFPSTWTYIHRGYPPKDEVKYICTGWMSLNTGS